MDIIEGHVEAYDLGGKKDLAQEISELESAEAIERELDALKARRAGQAPKD